jgi:hypothetical protein
MRRFTAGARFRTIAIAIVSIVGWYAYSTLRMPDIRPHVGDGQFQNCSFRFPWRTVGMPIPGYSITFEQIDLATPLEDTYHVEALPQIGRHAVVYLCIIDPQRNWRTDASRAQLVALIEIDVIDGDHLAVCHISQPISKMWWADPEGGPSTYGLHRVDESSFVPARGQKYDIRVRYLPDPQLSGMKGFIYIRCGGSI